MPVLNTRYDWSVLTAALAVALLLLVLIPVCQSTWQFYGEPVPYHFALQPEVFPADLVLGTDDGLHVLLQGQWTIYDSGDRPVIGAVETVTGEILVLIDDPGDTGGIYRLNPDLSDFDLLAACDYPEFLRYSPGTRRYLVGTPDGLLNSLDGTHWFHVEHFVDFPVSAVTDIDPSGTGLQLLAQDIEGLHVADLAPNFDSVNDLGLLEHEPISEASGMAASSRNPGVLWTHNDSGGAPAFYAFTTNGTHLGVYTVDGVTNRDWEDMALATIDGVSYLYAADIGDNSRVHDIKYVYCVPEPEVDPMQSPGTWTLTGAETLEFQYPDDMKYDAETMMVDPETSDLFVVTKRNHNNGATDDDDDLVFKVTWPEPVESTGILRRLADFVGFSSYRDPVIAEYITILDTPVGTSWGAGYGSTAGDIDPSGTDIVTKTYTGIYIQQRLPGQTLAEAFSNDWTQLPYTIEPQGEAICWAPDAMGYYTTSEEPYSFLQAHLNYFQRFVWSPQGTDPEFSFMKTHSNGYLYGIISNGSNSDGVYRSMDNGLTWTWVLRSSGITSLEFTEDNFALLGWHDPKFSGQPSDRTGAGWLNLYNGFVSEHNHGLWNQNVTGVSVDGESIWLSTSKGCYFYYDSLAE